jgi:nickel transport protein
MKKVIVFTTVLILLFIQAASAHHLWIEKQGERFKVAWGHPPKIDPYEPDRVKEIKAFDMTGKIVKLERINEEDKIYLFSKTHISMITLAFEGGYLVSTTEGKKRLTKREAQEAGMQVIDSFYSLQFAKSIFGYSDTVTKPAGIKFEIVPLKNPYTSKGGEFLPVRVFFDGKPMEGITIETGNHMEAGKTDKEGNANVRISEKGMQVILAKYRIPAKDTPDADYLSFTTVLTFERK